MTDETMAEQVRSDRIDILVDLAAHSSKNRLLVFARKPAPVQATYLAYCSTTGLRTIDYRITDPHLDPPGMDETGYSEETIRLPETYWCYRPHIDTGPPSPTPSLTNGRVTFGCLNNFGKITEPTLETWRDLLRKTPGSRLLLHAHPGSHRDKVRDFFGPEIPVEFVGFVGVQEYYRLYDRIDIGLDPFPYGGGTTTCDALWMGVPVVTLSGKIAVARAGRSILTNAGLAEMVATSMEEYVRIAAELASDPARLTDLRAGLRDRVRRSPLSDATRFAAAVEAAYRSMWRRWCAMKANADFSA